MGHNRSLHDVSLHDVVSYRAVLCSVVLMIGLLLAACIAPTPGATLPQPAAAAVSGDGSPVTALAFSPNGRWVVAGHANGAVEIVDAPSAAAAEESAGTARRTLGAHAGRVAHVAVAGDAGLVASAGQDKQVVVWPVSGGDGAALGEAVNQANSLDFSPLRPDLAVAYWQQVELWDAGDPAAAPRTLQQRVPSTALARYLPDGVTLAVAQANTGRAQSAIFVERLPSGETLQTLSIPAPAQALALSADGARLAAADAAAVHLWTLGQGQAPAWSAPAADVRTLAFSADGSELATVARETGEVQVWNSADGALLRSASTGERVNFHAALAPDLSMVAIGLADGAVRFMPLPVQEAP